MRSVDLIRALIRRNWRTALMVVLLVLLHTDPAAHDAGPAQRGHTGARG